ncbi:uncharacterized protein LOC143006131 [Genypterus blacodes]|uniref:uncharacterized protein LOC143006131 n=1 Tax=Genypterus blacodes TaxID=154954 RepID=UPI003F762CA1
MTLPTTSVPEISTSNTEVSDFELYTGFVPLLVISVLGIVGNVFVLLVFCLHKKSCTVAEIYFSNLAAADLLLMACLAIFVANIANMYNWYFDPALCILVKISMKMNACCSIYILVLVSIDRYVALVHPMSYGRMRRPKYAKLGCVLVWGFSLKRMLKTFVDDTGKDWDRWLPFILFAYREVPQASTGFSPFELLYGWDVQGPLDLLRKSWEAPRTTPSDRSVVQFVLDTNRLEKYQEEAEVNMREAQKSQKCWYDQQARHREFQPGQKVLLLLPSSNHKLLATWQGPYSITAGLAWSRTRSITRKGKKQNRPTTSTC